MRKSQIASLELDGVPMHSHQAKVNILHGFYFDQLGTAHPSVSDFVMSSLMEGAKLHATLDHSSSIVNRKQRN
jgi:hypothetical protein